MTVILRLERINREVRKTIKNDLGSRKIDSIIKIRHFLIWQNSEARLLIQKGLVKSQVDEKRKSKFLTINGGIQKFHFRDGKQIVKEKLKGLKDVLAKK